MANSAWLVIILVVFISNSKYVAAKEESIPIVPTIADACMKISTLFLKGKPWVFNGIKTPGVSWDLIDRNGIAFNGNGWTSLDITAFRGTVRFKISLTGRSNRLSPEEVQKLAIDFPNIDIRASKHISRFQTAQVPLEKLEEAEELTIGINPRKYPPGVNPRVDLLNVTNWILSTDRNP